MSKQTGTFVKEVQGRTMMYCADCGFEEEVRTPIVVSQLCDIIDGFNRRHADCRQVPAKTSGVRSKRKGKESP